MNTTETYEAYLVRRWNDAVNLCDKQQKLNDKVIEALDEAEMQLFIWRLTGVLLFYGWLFQWVLPV